VLAVHGPEPVADVGVGQLRQPARQHLPLRVLLAGLAELEPHVLEHRDIAAAQPGHGGGGRRPGHVTGERHRPAEQLGQPVRHRPQRRAARRAGRVLAALRPAEVGADDHPGPPAGQRGQGRQAGPDPAVVGDHRAVARHVEVGAEQDRPPGDVEVVDPLHQRPSRPPTSAVTSTRRLE
jgi:hypothetical protein